MKIRSGFVSNSSSSSFVGYGVHLSDSELDDAIKKVAGKVDEEDWDRHWNICEDNDLDCGSPYDDGMIIGLTFDHMKGTETKNEFRKRTKELVKKAFGADVASQVCEQEHAWRDG